MRCLVIALSLLLSLAAYAQEDENTYGSGSGVETDNGTDYGSQGVDNGAEGEVDTEYSGSEEEPAGVELAVSVPEYPELVLVPGYPVYYNPHADSNYFFFDGLYWLYFEDTWYASSWYNGPWRLVEPYYVPEFILRVPVRYYHRPPEYFFGWREDAPPRWGDHWGRSWEDRRHGWDRWDHRYTPAAAPLPTYQRRYSGNMYPRAAAQQHSLRTEHYSYQPREAVSKQHFQKPSTSPRPAGNLHNPQPSHTNAQPLPPSHNPQPLPPSHTGGQPPPTMTHNPQPSHTNAQPLPPPHNPPPVTHNPQPLPPSHTGNPPPMTHNPQPLPPSHTGNQPPPPPQNPHPKNPPPPPPKDKDKKH